MQFVELDLSGILVLDPADQLARRAEARGHYAARRSRVHAFGQHVDTQRAGQVAAQRGRAPELLVVAALGIEADDEVRRADAVLEQVDVVGQVEAAAFLAALDDDDAVRMRDALFLQRANSGERPECCVAVVGAAAAVQLAVLDDGLPRVEIVIPAAELGLLVVVAIEQDDFVRVAGNVDEQHRRASLDAHDLDRHVLDRLRLAPGLEHLHGRFHVAVLLPVRVEVRRLVRDLYVFGDLRDDRVIPHLADKLGRLLIVHLVYLVS